MLHKKFSRRHSAASVALMDIVKPHSDEIKRLDTIVTLHVNAVAALPKSCDECEYNSSCNVGDSCNISCKMQEQGSFHTATVAKIESIQDDIRESCGIIYSLLDVLNSLRPVFVATEHTVNCSIEEFKKE